MIYKLYKEITIKLVGARATLEFHQKEMERLSSGPKDVKAYDPANQSSHFTPLPLEKQYERIAELRDIIAYDEMRIQDLEDEKRKLDELVDKLCEEFQDDLELKVFKMYHLQGMKLVDIANILNYSPHWIKHVNMKINRKMKLDTPKTPLKML